MSAKALSIAAARFFAVASARAVSVSKLAVRINKSTTIDPADIFLSFRNSESPHRCDIGLPELFLPNRRV
jgi:hypothetical protein